MFQVVFAQIITFEKLIVAGCHSRKTHNNAPLLYVEIWL